jgi:hypothetical protein
MQHRFKPLATFGVVLSLSNFNLGCEWECLFKFVIVSSIYLLLSAVTAS